jgi:hypothetical protein
MSRGGDIPDITRGLGLFDVALWKRYARNAVEFEELYPLLQEIARIPRLLERLEGQSQAMQTVIWARIDDASTAGDGLGPVALRQNDAGLDVAWRYPWQRVEIDDATDNDYSVIDITRGTVMSGTIGNNYALNGVEANNGRIAGTNLVAPGVIADPDDGSINYPGGFEPQPIQGRPVVPMFFMLQTDGTFRPMFFLSNAHDGNCGGG